MKPNVYRAPVATAYDMLFTAPYLTQANAPHLIITPNNKVGRMPLWLAANLVCSTATPLDAAIDVRQ